MAKRFLILTMPRKDIAEKREDWVLQTVDLIEQTEAQDIAATFPAITLVKGRPESDSWSIASTYRRSFRTPGHKSGFHTQGFECGGFTAGGTFILSFDTPDSIVLIANEDLEVFLGFCADLDIIVQRAAVIAE